MKKDKVYMICQSIADMHNERIEAINAGLSPIEYLKTTIIYVVDNNGNLWHAKEWHIAEELEKYYQEKNEKK
jgi:hypothetical protein